MKKARRKAAARAAVSVLLLAAIIAAYFALPVRPIIAAAAANKYVQENYGDYDLPRAEIVAHSLRERRVFGVNIKWISEYGAQANGGRYLAAVSLNGWFPFIVRGGVLWELRDGESVTVAGNEDFLR